jgi:hypothetical protein
MGPAPFDHTMCLEKELKDLGKRLVVKRTFLQVETDLFADDEITGSRGRRARSFSDPCDMHNWQRDVDSRTTIDDIPRRVQNSGQQCSSSEVQMHDVMQLMPLSEEEAHKEIQAQNAEESLKAVHAHLYKTMFSTARNGEVSNPAASATHGADQSQPADFVNTESATKEQMVTSIAHQPLPAQMRFTVPTTSAGQNRAFPSTQTGAAKVEANAHHDSRTTLMLRNIPNDYTRDMFLELLDSRGYWCAYDFVYLPIDVHRGASLGYAFVNCISPLIAQQMRTAFEGYQSWRVSSQKVCEVCWGEPLQGMDAHIERFRNSPLMHKSVPDECRPICIANGVRVAFPSPTKRIRAPKKSDSS